MKSAELDFVKSAGYIEGFLERAVEHGATIKQAVDLYEQAFIQTADFVKQAQELTGAQHKLDVDGDGNIGADDLKKLRKGKNEKNEIDEKTAAYYEGILERAREYGFSDSDALDFVKSSALALPAPTLAGRFGAATSSVGKSMNSSYNKAKEFGKGFLKGNKADKVRGEGHEAFTKGKNTASFLRSNKNSVAFAAGAAGGAGGLAIANSAKKKTEKEEDTSEKENK
jgi:hypothetical protein